MQHLSSKEAFEFLRHNPEAMFIDCRSEIEYLFVGHPVGATHIAWSDGPDWEVNPQFVDEVARLAGGLQRPIVLICRSGNRSEKAGEALERAGFQRIYNVSDGFEGELDAQHHRNTLGGWRVEGLPWEQT